MELKNLYPTIIIIVAIGLVLGVGIFILGTFQSDIFTVNSTETSSQIILTESTATLTPIGGRVDSNEVNIYNQAWLDFNGSSDYISVPDSENFSINNSDMLSISFWIKPSFWNFTGVQDTVASMGYVTPLSKFNASHYEWRFTLHNGTTTDGITYTNNITFEIFNLTSLTGNSSHFEINRTDLDWIHIVGVVNGSDTLLYVNGTLEDHDIYSRIIPEGGTVPVRIGTGNLTSYFNGSMDEIRIYERALTDTNVLNIYNSGRVRNNTLNSTNLTMWLKFDENSNTVAYDVSGSNDGTITGATWNNSGELSTLIETTDYTITAAGLFTIVNENYIWTWTNASYEYTLINELEGYDAMGSTITGVATFADWIAIIVVVIAAAIVLGVILSSFGRERNRI